MTVNVNFSDYFFSCYSNKDEPINDTTYFYKIWCYKQHKLLRLSLFIWVQEIKLGSSAGAMLWLELVNHEKQMVIHQFVMLLIHLKS